VFKKYKETGIFDKEEIYPYITEGIGEDFLPANVDFSLIDHFEKVSDRDAAMMTRRIPREEGIFVGNSAGAALAGMVQMKHLFKAGDVVVVIFHDHGTRYLGKMYNDEWMRDRGFLEESSPKAIDMIECHKHQKLLTIEETAPVSEAIKLMRDYDISQLPVVSGSDFTGSLSDSHLYARLIDNPELRHEPVKTLMQKPFPFVAPQASLEEVSSLINRENDAVLVRDMLSEVHIITKYDIIEAIG
jgi:cystathionine beta-synthase